MAIDSALPPYPGRGIIHLTDRNGVASWVYFVTGRSTSSRARQVRIRGDHLAIEPTEATTGQDELRHYVCARKSSQGLIIGNGDHVDVIAEGLDQGTPLTSILAGIDPEPDPPIWTPRIALVIGERTVMTAVSQTDGSVSREVHAIPVAPSTASLLTTYSGIAADPIGNAPYITMKEDWILEDLSEQLWNSLDSSLRVLLVAGPAATPAASGPVEWSISLS